MEELGCSRVCARTSDETLARGEVFVVDCGGCRSVPVFVEGYEGWFAQREVWLPSMSWASRSLVGAASVAGGVMRSQGVDDILSGRLCLVEVFLATRAFLKHLRSPQCVHMWRFCFVMSAVC